MTKREIKLKAQEAYDKVLKAAKAYDIARNIYESNPNRVEVTAKRFFKASRAYDKACEEAVGIFAKAKAAGV